MLWKVYSVYTVGTSQYEYQEKNVVYTLWPTNADRGKEKNFKNINMKREREKKLTTEWDPLFKIFNSKNVASALFRTGPSLTILLMASWDY